MERVQTRLQNFAASGQFGIFAGGYWGHEAYDLSPEANLLPDAAYLAKDYPAWANLGGF